MQRLLRDIRYGFRTVIHDRFVSILAILALALGIGVTTAVFSIFNGVLLKPLAYPDPHELVMVYDTQPALSTAPASFPKYHDWKARQRVFAAIGGSTNRSFVLTGVGEPERITGAMTTASMAGVLRIQPALGRWYREDEDLPNGPKVAVLGDGLWNRRFARDPAILGRRLLLDGEPYEIIGIMPESFLHRGAEVFVPLQRELDPSTRGSHFLPIYARLQPGMSAERAAREMRALGDALAREFGHNHGVDVVPLFEVVVGGIRTPLTLLLGAVFLVLLIACANVANLLLASGLARRRELAIRLALGAGQRDLIRQLTAEAVVLAAIGGAIGVLLASWIVRTFLQLSSDVLPRAASVAIDGRVLAFTAALSLVVGVLCAVWPLLRLRTGDLASAVREGDLRTASGTGTTFGSGLVLAEIAIAFTLLVGAGLLLKNLVLLTQRPTGIQVERLVSFDVAPAGPKYAEPGRTVEFYRTLLERLRPVGGVHAVGITSHLPMYRFGWNGEMTIEGGNPWGPLDNPLVEYRWIGGDYFRTMGIPLLQGRLFDKQDREGATAVVVINKTMAEKFWSGQSPIGKRIAQGNSTNWLEVIGVVGDVRSYGLTSRTPYELYFTIEQRPFTAMTVVIRSSAHDPTSVIASARQIVGAIDPTLPVTGVQTMEQVVTASVGQPRLLSALTALFGVLAGLLAMVGIYGVTAYNVRRQRREFGIRLALGADGGAVRRLVLRRGLTVALAGIALGALGASLVTNLLQALLHDVKPHDLSVFVAGAALVLLVSLVACYLPARAAGRVDPMVVLRDS